MPPDPRSLDPRFWYLGLVGLVAVQRLGEMVLSKRHVRRLEQGGGREVGQGHYRWMVILHVAFLGSCALEPWLADRHFGPLAGPVALAVLLAAQGMRIWTMRSLGVLWTTRVMVVPGAERVTTGPYRWMRHPVYLAVFAEIVALPMVFGGWVTAATFTVLNLGIVAARVRIENTVLDAMPIPAGVKGALPWR